MPEPPATAGEGTGRDDALSPGGGAGEPRPLRVNLDITHGAILKVLGTLALLWLLAGTWQVIIWVILALMFVATFNPLVRRLQARTNRPWAIIAVVLLAVLAVAAVLAVLVPVFLRQGQSLGANLPQYLTQAEEMARRAHVRLNLHAPVQQWSARLSTHALDLSLLLIGSLMGLLTVFTLTIYLLIEGPQVATQVISLFPKKERLPARRMFGEIGDQVGAYMRGQLLTSVLAGVFAFVVLSLMRVPEPLALAVLMMVADVVPLVGPLIGTIPAVLMALTRGVPSAVIVLIAYVVYLQLEANLIVPRVYGNALKLSPLIVLVAFLIGAALLGMLGVLLALPTAAAIPILARYIMAWRERVDAEGSGPVPLP